MVYGWAMSANTCGVLTYDKPGLTDFERAALDAQSKAWVIAGGHNEETNEVGVTFHASRIFAKRVPQATEVADALTGPLVEDEVVEVLADKRGPIVRYEGKVAEGFKLLVSELVDLAG